MRRHFVKKLNIVLNYDNKIAKQLESKVSITDKNNAQESLTDFIFVFITRGAQNAFGQKGKRI